MPNPALRHPHPGQAAEPFQPHPEHGILAQVGGQFIAAGSDSLPKAGPGEDSLQTVVVEVPSLGKVQLTYQLKTHKHGKSRNWFWVAVRADAVEG